MSGYLVSLLAGCGCAQLAASGWSFWVGVRRRDWRFVLSSAVFSFAALGTFWLALTGSRTAVPGPGFPIPALLPGIAAAGVLLLLGGLRTVFRAGSRTGQLDAAIAKAFDGRRQLDQACQLCAEAIRKYADAGCVKIWTVCPEGQDLELQASAVDSLRGGSQGDLLPDSDARIAAIAAQGRPLLMNQLPAAAWPVFWRRRRNGGAAFAGYPLTVEGRVEGVVAVIGHRPLADPVRTHLERCGAAIGHGVARLRAEGTLRGLIQRLETSLEISTSVVRQSEDYYRDLVENSHNLICTHDLDGKILSVNSWPAAILGYTQEEMTQMNLGDILAPEVRPWLPFYLAQVRRRGRAKGLMIVQTRSGDKRIWQYNNSLRTEGVPVPIVRGVAHDITELRRMESERERLMTAIEQSGEGVMITDPDGNVEYVNPSFTQITGYGREEILGKNQRAFHIAGDYDSAPVDLWRDITAGEGAWRGPMRHKKRDGTLATWNVTISPVRNASGVIVNYVEVLRDVTEELKIQQHYQQVQKMESIGRLAGGVAHDFNNMLTVINGYSQLLLSQIGRDDPIRPALQEISTAGNRAASLTQQLLAYSRKQVMQTRTMDLNRIVVDALPMLERLLGASVEVQTGLSREGAFVNADPHQMQQVILNLAVNAREAMPGGGSVRIETVCGSRNGRESGRRPGEAPGGYVGLVVSDTGIGMDKATAQKIFEPFFTTKGRGTGLGLSMVHGIVTQSGGHIEVESEPGRGATFWVWLPERNRPAEVLADAAPAPVVGGTERLLLVEDQSVVRSYAAQVLRSYGYDVLQAENADAALAIVRREGQSIDLLLTDVVMPRRSGLELAAEIETLRPGLKILLMSGYVDETAASEIGLPSRRPFLQKPFGPGALARKVRDVLGPPVGKPVVEEGDDRSWAQGS